LDEVHEYEETGGRFKINGYYYNFSNESKTKNNYYLCNKRRNTIKCRGSITISPSGQIIKKVEHSCQSQNQILEEVHEYEEKNRRFKINGYYYSFQHEFKSKNQYYVCNKRKGQKCRGSITISPNRQIIKKVEHTCQFQEENLPDINAEILPGNEQNKERHSLPEIKVLFWFGYFAFTFN
jgi:hypothetical protein